MARPRGFRMHPSPIVMALVLAGCGAGGPAEDRRSEAIEVRDEAPAVDPATAAIVTGRVVFVGEAPAATPIDMSEEPTCAAKHASGATAETVVVNPNGTLRNVFVYVKEGLGNRTFPAPSEPVILDQDGCVYHPHVVGVRVGQRLTIRNSDGILHNINASPSQNRGFNISQPTNMESTRTFTVPEVMIPIACDVHGWMQAYVGVLEHPYFSVTGEEGTFSLAQLPPGDYVIEAWHERYGTQTINISLGAQETRSIEFRFDATTAASAVVPLGAPVDPHDHHGETTRARIGAAADAR